MILIYVRRDIVGEMGLLGLLSIMKFKFINPQTLFPIWDNEQSLRSNNPKCWRSYLYNYLIAHECRFFSFRPHIIIYNIVWKSKTAKTVILLPMFSVFNLSPISCVLFSNFISIFIFNYSASDIEMKLISWKFCYLLTCANTSILDPLRCKI